MYFLSFSGNQSQVPIVYPVIDYANGGSALEFQLRAWTNRLDRHLMVRSELGVAVYAALREAGFSIPFPQQEIRIHPAPPPESAGR